MSWVSLRDIVMRVQDPQGSWFECRGFAFRVWGLGFRVLELRG